MKTSSLPRLPAAGLGLLFSLLLATTAPAGPGPQFWAAQGKAKAAINEPVKAFKPCAGAREVSVTMMRPALSNGKGPLVETRIGTRTVCHICPVTRTVVRNVQANGRGPVTISKTTVTGVEHDCATCTGTPAKS